MGRQERRSAERKLRLSGQPEQPQPTPEQEQLLEMSGELQKTEGLLNLLRATEKACVRLGPDYTEVLERIKVRIAQTECDLADAMIEMVLIADPEFDDKKIEPPTADEIASLG